MSEPINTDQDGDPDGFATIEAPELRFVSDLSRAADAAFIAHARTAAPLLAAEVVRLHEATCANCVFNSSDRGCKKHVAVNAMNAALLKNFGCNFHEPR